MDYPALLKALHALGLDLPLMLEHMSDPQADVLGEPLTWRVVLGAGMITIGTLVLIR